MKLFNMRDNSELGPLSLEQLEFLKKNLLKEVQVKDKGKNKGEEEKVENEGKNERGSEDIVENEKENDEDFFIHSQNLKELKKRAETPEEKEICKILAKQLSQEFGEFGLDVYYE